MESVCTLKSEHLQAAINFALYSAGGTGVSLCLFTDTDLQNGNVTYEVDLHNIYNKTGDVWHIALPQLDNSLMYGAYLLLYMHARSASD